MKSKSRIIIFGASTGGINAYSYLKKTYELVAFADNDYKKHGQTLLGYPILSADALQNVQVDKIVIASTYGLQIHRQLVYEVNIPAAKIIRLPNSSLKKAHPLYYLSFFMVAIFWLTIAGSALSGLSHWF